MATARIVFITSSGTVEEIKRIEREPGGFKITLHGKGGPDGIVHVDTDGEAIVPDADE